MCVEGNIISLEFNQIKMYLDSPMNVSKKHNQIRNMDSSLIWIKYGLELKCEPFIALKPTMEALVQRKIHAKAYTMQKGKPLGNYL